MKKSLDNVYLVGPMGAGKTTIGRILAKELNMEFIDSDYEIESRAGANISWIFDVEGEPGFRERERKIIAELTTRKGIVLATGGGAVLQSDNRKFLQSRGTVIYLMTTINQQVERTRRDVKRPLLQGIEDPVSKLSALMEERDPLYREVSDHVIMTSKRSPKVVSTEITTYLMGEGEHG